MARASKSRAWSGISRLSINTERGLYLRHTRKDFLNSMAAPGYSYSIFTKLRSQCMQLCYIKNRCFALYHTPTSHMDALWISNKFRETKYYQIRLYNTQVIERNNYLFDCGSECYAREFMSDILCVPFPKVSHVLLFDQTLLEFLNLWLNLLTELSLHLLDHLKSGMLYSKHKINNYNIISSQANSRHDGRDLQLL